MKEQFLSKPVPRGPRTIWRYLSALILLFSLSIGQMWAAWQTTTVDGTIGTRDSISTDGLTREWNFTPATQQVKPSTTAFSEYNDMLFKAGSSDKLKSVAGSGWSCNSNSNIYIPVPTGSAGTITLSVYSTSDSRYLQLYKTKDNTVGTSAQRLYSKENASGITSDGKKGPRSFSFTATDTTMINGVAYLHFKDNNSEMKINGFSIVLTTGSYPVASGPVDPTITFNNGAYTIGGSDLDLSSLFTSNSSGTVTYTVKTDGGTNASISGTSFSATAAGTCAVTASQAAITGTYNAKSVDANIVVSAAETPVCPSGISISGTNAYTEDQTIILNAALEAGNGDISYTWYKGAILAENIVGTGATYTKANCTTADQGEYFCVASKTSCDDAASTAYAVTVEALVACATLNPATSGDAPASGDAIVMQSGSIGGTMSALSANLTYTANGLQFGTNSGTKASVTLNHLMQETTIISVTLVANGTGARGLKLYDAAGSNQVASLGWSSATNGEEKTFTYTVTGTDKLNGTNGFQLWRNNTVTLKSLQVFNCGAELYALNWSIYPEEAADKATVTLSKNLVLAGGTATATYSDIDAAYDFDEWEITSGDANIADASVNPAVITMGSTAATITLKLKVAGTKYAVHFDSKGGSAVADQEVNEGAYASVPTAPTKFKYTFGGWSETDGGSIPANLAEIAINAEKTFYAIWTPKVCPTSGIIYSFVSDGTKAPSSNTYCPASGVKGVVDIATYATVSGGLAQGVHTTTSNNPIQIQTSTSAVKLSHADGYFRALLECPLQIGDTIKFGKTNKVKMAFDSLRTKVVDVASGTGVYIVPTAYAGEDTIMIYYGGSSVNLTSLEVIRPVKYAVTFNMHGHGDAVDAQSITEGGKVTNPGTPSASGWDFGGWFKESTYDNEWDFANDVVSAATEIHAKWTEHTASSDATLSSLSYTIGGGDPIAITLVADQYAYAVELPMGTDINDVEVAAVKNDPNAKGISYVQPTSVLTTATVGVTAEDNTVQNYTIAFSVATSMDIELVWDKSKKRCDDSTPTANVKSDDASVSSYINKITFTGGGAEGSSLNVGNTAGNMFTLSAKAGYAFQALSFFGKIQDATCEYSLDGGSWTELASTKTDGDKCYANVFSAAEVHEFRLRSTGNNGVWIRNMQLNIIEACTPVAITWDEEPVEFEVGAAGQYIAATANNGEDVEYSSNAPLVIAVDAVNGLLSIGDLGSATLSASTAEGDGTTYCANGGNDIVINKVVNTYYLVKFDAQNGEEATEVKYFSGDAEIALPAAPSYPGYDFQGWFDAETGGNQYVEDITPAASITVYAQWQAQCPGATITTQPVGASYLTGRTATALVCEATAGNNGTLTYEWFTCDDDQKTNPVAASATPSTAVAGTFYYFCKVMEAGCDLEAYSDVVTITVSDKDPICLAWVDVTGQNAASLDASKSLFAPEVSAAGIKNSSTYDEKTGWKFNSAPGYIAIEGAPFKSGDIVEMFVTTTTADKARVFNANEAIAANIIAEGAANMVQGANRVALTADANNLYLRRGDDFGGWNPYVAYVAVYRACAPILNKVTVNGVEGAPVGNVVTIEVPASTTQSQLEAITFDWISNNDAWTAAHTPVATNAWEFGVANTVTLTDKDGDASVYTVTVNKAAASANVELATLTVNGNAVPVVPGQAVYSYELPYGTSAAPTVVATAEDANANVGTITQAASATGSATFTVTAEDGSTHRDYTINFSISKWKEVVIWDGSYMTELASSPDAATGFAWATTGFGSIASYNTTYGEKAYSKYLPSGGTAPGRYMALTVPAGYVAKFYIVVASHSDGSERGMFIGSNLVKDPDATSVLELSNNDRDEAVAGMSEIVGAGTWYINPNASIDFQEIRAYVRKGMVRNSMLGNGVLGTSCVDHNVAIEDIQGATFYELVGRDYNNYGKLAFDKINDGELEAGVPYVFQAHGDKLVLFYGETKVDDPVDKHNGMYGTFEQILLPNATLGIENLDDVYYFAQRALWSCDGAIDLTIPANRAYVKLSEIGEVPSSNPAPGRQRILMAVNGEKVPEVATGMDELNDTDAPVKVLINGQIFILRGEKMFDATGRLVK